MAKRTAWRPFGRGLSHALRRVGTPKLAAAVALAAALGAGAAQAEPGKLSGLPWSSGMSCFDRPGDSVSAVQWEIEGWRGRPLDVLVGWAPKDSWADMLKWMNGGGLSAFLVHREKSGEREGREQKARPVISLPLLTEEVPGQFAACARGEFEEFHKEAARVYKERRGKADAIFRLGWEANGDWYPWSIGNDKVNYKKCFKRTVNAIRSVDRGFEIEWSMAQKGKLTYNVKQAYPGNRFVDYIGVASYDRYPTATNQSEWDKLYKAKFNGGPQGLGEWLKFAKSKRKPLVIGEWGISNGYSDSGGTDNGFFIEKMTDFFKANAKDIGYEAYFNCQTTGVYRVFPTDINPNASAAYKEAYTGDVSPPTPPCRFRNPRRCR